MFFDYFIHYLHDIKSGIIKDYDLSRIRNDVEFLFFEDRLEAGHYNELMLFLNELCIKGF